MWPPYAFRCRRKCYEGRILEVQYIVDRRNKTAGYVLRDFPYAISFYGLQRVALVKKCAYIWRATGRIQHIPNRFRFFRALPYTVRCCRYCLIE